MTEEGTASMRVLDGVRVLDFGRFIAAPWCSALLADMGITSPTAAAPPRHPLVAVLLKIAPAPESERVAENYAALKASVSA